MAEDEFNGKKLFLNWAKAYDYAPISMQDVPPLEEKNVYTRE